MRKDDNQGYTGQLPQSQFERNRIDSDQTFFTKNYGGINKTSPSVDLPYSDSPEMLNCKISLAGSVAKREGSIIRQVTTGTPDGTTITTFTLINGKTLLISKIGKDLSIQLLPEETSHSLAQSVITYSNVWSTYASSKKPSISWTSEVHPRLLMATPSNTIVELEMSQFIVTGTGVNTIAVTGDYSGTWASSYTFGIYGDNVISLSNVNYSPPSTTFTFNSVIPSGQQVNLVQPVWHWWAEALKRTNQQSYASTYRFNTSVNADANVEIPTELKRGLEADSLSFGSSLAFGVKALDVWKSNIAAPTAFTFANQPDTKDKYAFSNKVFTDGTNYITPGTSWLTFGGIDGAGTNPPTPVHMVRQYYLPFNGGTGIVCSDVQVYNSAGLALQARYNATRAANSASNQYFWLLDSTMAVEVTNTNSVKALSFGGGYPFGVNEDYAEIINSKVSTTVIGTAAAATYYSIKTPGSYRPWYGASLYANFNTGVFPSVVGLYQDRLVLSGYASAPLTILLSNTGSDGSRYYYQNFQVDYDDTTLAYNPIEVVLDGSIEDSVTNLVSWFDSLFLTTRKTLRRIHGGTSVAVSPTNVFQNTISGVGCESKQGMTKTDDSVVFISGSGLYSVSTLSNTGEYTASNIGLKVKDYFFKNSLYPTKSWVFYNQLDDEIWVGLSSGDDPYLVDTCLVMFNQREAWSEYGLTGGFMPSVDGCSNSKRSFLCLVNRDTDITTQPSTSSQLLFTEFNVENVLTDLTIYPTYAQMLAGVTTNCFHRRLQITVDTNQRIISTLPAKQPTGYTNHGFRYLPVTDRDSTLKVRQYNGIYWSNKTLSGSNYSLIPSNYALKMLDSPYYTGDLLEIKLVNDSLLPPIHVFRDNYELTQVTDYTVAESGHYQKVTLAVAGNVSSSYLVGQTIPCWHFTPTFFRQAGIGTLKRVVHYSGYYSNKYYHDLWGASDANVVASQTVGEISDSYKVSVGVSLGVLYNDARNGMYESEVYGSSSLYWDFSTFDYNRDAYRNQQNDVVRCTIPVIGLGYSFQIVNFDFSIKRFELIGYTVITKPKGHNSTRWY